MGSNKEYFFAVAFSIVFLGIGYIILLGEKVFPILLLFPVIGVILYFLFFELLFKLASNKTTKHSNPRHADKEVKQNMFFLSLLFSLSIFVIITLSTLFLFQEKTYQGKVSEIATGYDKFGNKNNIRISLDKNSKYTIGTCYSRHKDFYFNQIIYMYYVDTIFGVRFIKGYRLNNKENTLQNVGCNMFLSTAD